MEQEALITKLKGSLKDLVTIFEENEGYSFSDLLDDAVKEHHIVVPFRRRHSLSLVAGQAEYDAPPGFFRFGSTDWGQPSPGTKPWDLARPSRSYTLQRFEGDDGVKVELNNVPTADEISRYGSTFKFSYYSKYEDLTQVKSEDETLILLRARAQAFLVYGTRELSRDTKTSNAKGRSRSNAIAEYERLIKIWRGLR